MDNVFSDLPSSAATKPFTVNEELSLTDMLLPGQEDAFWKTAKVAHNNWLINSQMVPGWRADAPWFCRALVAFCAEKPMAAGSRKRGGDHGQLAAEYR